MQHLSPPVTGIYSFGKYPIYTDLEQPDADTAVLGAPANFVVEYMGGTCLGPRCVWEASTQYSHGETSYYDFEHDCQRLVTPLKIVDCGDADILQAGPQHILDVISDSVREILRRGAVPIVLDDGHLINAPVGNTLEELGEEICVVQFSVHLDWSDHVDPLRYGNGSLMHRLSEMGHIGPMIQTGLYGIGSNKKTDFDNTKKYNSVFISLHEADQMGVEDVLARVPKAKNYYTTVDINGFDMPITPGVALPYPDGPLFDQVYNIISGVAEMDRIVAADLVEIAPSFDPPGITVYPGTLTMLHIMGQIETQIKEQHQNS